jgi:macrolide transport system ATP-binding/permease protein
MRRLRAAVFRLIGLVTRGRRERAFDDELDSHLQMHIDDNLRAGMSPEEARRRALLKLGGVESTRQAYRERSSVPFLEHLWQDLRFALRQLSKTPGVTATAIVTLALGMGAAVAIYAFVDAALVEPLPYPQPTRLLNVTETTPQIPRAALSYPDYVDWKRLNTVFSSLDVHMGRGYSLKTSTGIELVQGARVSDGFFRTLGVAPALGRDFYTGEDLPGKPDTLIISYAAWHARFGGRRDVIGQTVTLAGDPHTIVGVLPEHFQFAPQGRAEFWTPLRATVGCDVRRSCHALSGVGRLKDGVTVDEAHAQMNGIAKQLEREYPDSNRDQGASVLSLADVIVGDIRPMLLLLLGGAALLLAIACVNVVSLLLVRSEGRKRELAVRSTLGASNGRLIRQFVTEAFVLVASGSALGLLFASSAVQLLFGLISEDMRGRMPYLDGVGMNPRVAACAGVLAVIATAIFSLTPAVRVRFSELREGLAEGTRGSSGNTWRRLGFKLVVLELATAMVLLVGASLLGQSLYRLLNVDLGFEPDRLATMQVAAPGARFESDEQQLRLGREVASRVARLPGVQSVGLVDLLPVTFNGNTNWIRFPGRPYNGEHNEVNSRVVSAGYFATVRARLLRGRGFTDRDTASAPRVVVINQTLAKKYYPDEDPIGKRYGDTSLSAPSMKEIVGIVDDIREGPLNSEIWPAEYVPFEQDPDNFFTVVVRTSQTEASVLPAMSAAIRAIDPDLGARRGIVMRDRIQDSPAAYLQRSSAWLVGGFAALALLLGIVGLYGVIAYSVSQRTREIGLRLAMGAQRRAVYELILGEAGRLIALGLVLGLAGSIAAARLMRTLLFDPTPWDVTTLASVAVVLAAAAMLASYIPARRAASVNPIEALRVE